MITNKYACASLIEDLQEQNVNHKLREMKMQKRISKDAEAFEMISAELNSKEQEKQLLLSEEGNAPAEFAMDLKLMQLRLNSRLLHLQSKKETVSPDALAYPMFQLHLLTNQRLATEEFVNSLQKRLKKLSGDTGKTQKAKPTKNNGRRKKAA